MSLSEMLQESVSLIRKYTDRVPVIGLVLGSGLGDLTDEIKDTVSIAYKDIPHFKLSTAIGHEGKLIFGELANKAVVAMKGRLHFYEGYNISDITYPIHVMKELGVKYLILTNAAGGISLSFSPGDLVLIRDHINFAFKNPLRGRNDDTLGERFPDMSNAYDARWRKRVKEISAKNGMNLQEGTYLWTTGPSYETPAEIKAFRNLGADMVGMSTVPEVIVANYRKIKVLGISCISNMAAGILNKPLTHEEVIEVTGSIKDKFKRLIRVIIEDV
ncbi:MAG: purine-nucleoside phosphorylase [Thermotogae bacterium]|nr:purine-nucleoside phosphorylase [Thermotogota bacterium]